MKPEADLLVAVRVAQHCFKADGRHAEFLIDEGPLGDGLMAKLAKQSGYRGPSGVFVRVEAWVVKE